MVPVHFNSLWANDGCQAKQTDSTTQPAGTEYICLKTVFPFFSEYTVNERCWIDSCEDQIFCFTTVKAKALPAPVPPRWYAWIIFWMDGPPLRHKNEKLLLNLPISANNTNWKPQWMVSRLSLGARFWPPTDSGMRTTHSDTGVACPVPEDPGEENFCNCHFPRQASPPPQTLSPTSPPTGCPGETSEWCACAPCDRREPLRQAQNATPGTERRFLLDRLLLRPPGSDLTTTEHVSLNVQPQLCRSRISKQ